MLEEEVYRRTERHADGDAVTVTVDETQIDIDGMSYLTALTGHELSSPLHYAERNYLGRWLQTLTSRSGSSTPTDRAVNRVCGNLFRRFRHYYNRDQPNQALDIAPLLKRCSAKRCSEWSISIIPKLARTARPQDSTPLRLQPVVVSPPHRNLEDDQDELVDVRLPGHHSNWLQRVDG